MGDILWMQLKGKIGRVLKDCQNESFRELGPSQNFKFSFRLYCCVALTETKQLPQVLQIFDDRNAQNLIFWFSRFRSLWVLRFQKFLNRTKCHNSRTISPFNFKFGLRLDGLPVDLKSRACLDDVRGVIKKILKSYLKEVKMLICLNHPLIINKSMF